MGQATLLFDSIEIEYLEIPFKTPFLTAKGRLESRKLLLLKGISGSDTVWAECAAFEDDFYFGYGHAACEAIFKTLIPELIGLSLDHPRKAYRFIAELTQNSCCQAALDTLYWQLYAKQQQQHLALALGGKVQAQKIVVPLGLDTQLSDLSDYYDKGLDAFKIKVTAKTLKYWAQIKTHLPIQIILDANGSLGCESIADIKSLEPSLFKGLEQPFLAEESSLYQQLKDSAVKIYLDESIQSLASAKQLIEELPHCALTLKAARLGGISPCIDLLKAAPFSRIGGMFESEIGRKVLYALSCLSPALSDGGPVGLYLNCSSTVISNKLGYYSY